MMLTLPKPCLFSQILSKPYSPSDGSEGCHHHYSFPPSFCLHPHAPATHALGFSHQFSSKPWASIHEWGEERRAESQRPGASKPHVVHLYPRKNNTFVTVTYANVNKKYSASIWIQRAQILGFLIFPHAKHFHPTIVSMS